MAYGPITSSLGISELLDRYMKAKKDRDEALAQQYLADLSKITGEPVAPRGGASAFGIQPPINTELAYVQPPPDARLAYVQPPSDTEQTDVQPPPFQLPPPSPKFALTGGTPGPFAGSLMGTNGTQGDVSESSQPPIEMAASTLRPPSMPIPTTQPPPAPHVSAKPDPLLKSQPLTKATTPGNLSASPVTDQSSISTKGKILMGGLGLAAILAGALGGGAYGAASVAEGIASGVKGAREEEEKKRLLAAKVSTANNAAFGGMLKSFNESIEKGDDLGAALTANAFVGLHPEFVNSPQISIMKQRLDVSIAKHGKEERDKQEKSALETTKTKQEIEQKAWSMSAKRGAQVSLGYARERYKDDPEGLQKYFTDILEPQYRDAKARDDLERRGKEADVKQKEQEKPEKGKATQAESINIYNHLIDETGKEIEGLVNEVVQKVPGAEKKKADAELKLQGLKNTRDIMMQSFNIGGVGQENTITQAQINILVQKLVSGGMGFMEAQQKATADVLKSGARIIP